MEPDYNSILKYFKYDHLPLNLQSLSKHFHDMAHGLVEAQRILKRGNSAEVLAGLRKLNRKIAEGSIPPGAGRNQQGRLLETALNADTLILEQKVRALEERVKRLERENK